MIQFLNKISQSGIHVDFVEGKLKLYTKNEKIDPDLLNEIKLRKEEIIVYLTQKIGTGNAESIYSPIERVLGQDDYSASNAQTRIWVLSRLEESNAAYNMPFAIEFTGSTEHLKKAIYLTIERHESLRTVFFMNDDDILRQKILEIQDLGFTIAYRDFRKEVNAMEHARTYINHDNHSVFDLEKGPLVRASLLQIDEDKYIFHCNMHHIISDGWSVNVLLKDVMEYYNALQENRVPNVAALNIQYKDYSAWQLSQVQSEDFKVHKEYWKQKFQGEIPLLDLPTEKIRPNVKSYQGKRLETYLDPETTEKIKMFCRQNDGSLFTGLLAALHVLLYRYTSQKDIVIGSPVSGRNHIYLENQIGFYVNTLALRNSLDPNESFQLFYNQVKESTLEAYEHQMYPFDQLVNDLNNRRDTSRSPVFDIILTLHNFDEKGELNHSENENPYDIKDKGFSFSKFDMEIAFREVDDQLLFAVNYITDLYEEEMICNLMIHFKQLLNGMLSSPETPLDKIDYLTEAEKRQLLFEFNQTEADYPKENTIIDLFKEQVQKRPDQTALIFKDKKISYSELDHISTQLSEYLIKEYRIGPDDLIGVKLERNEWLIITLLGILKAGSAYVPIDPMYPLERIEYIEGNCNCKVSINQSILMDFIERQSSYSSEAQCFSAHVHHLAYVIYTSGSTGKPKGVMCTHSNVVSLIKPGTFMNITDREIIFATGSPSFDISTFEYYGALLNGATLLMAEQSALHDLNTIMQLLEEHLVTNIYLTPALLNKIVDENIQILAKLNKIITGGEKASAQHINKIYKNYPHIKIVEAYGPTENTTFSTTQEIQKEYTDIPIGMPLPNRQVYILDKKLNPVPIGVIGEICVGGDGIAVGYLGLPELTEEKFIENPFIPGKRIYKTGDLGNWLKDGSIVFKGRNDEQVKIRGYRIELGEIEKTLQDHQAINKAIIAHEKDEDGNSHLVAYLQKKKNLRLSQSPDMHELWNEEMLKDFSVENLRDYLKKTLPEYMIPGQFIEIHDFPLTANGKVDKKSLCFSGGISLKSGAEFVEPTNEKEYILKEIWEQVLKCKNVGIKDSFFNLGGDSIKSIQLVSRLKQKGYTLKFEDVLKHPVLEDLVKYIKENKAVVNQSEVIGEVAFTPIQKYFFENRSIINKNHFNQSVILKSSNEVNPDVLEQTISSLVSHHDALRMVYKSKEDVWSQYNEDSSGIHYKIHFYDLREVPNELEKLAHIGGELQSGIDISSGILFHVGHFRMSDGDRLVLIIHHLVIDGVSWRILLEDFSKLYESYQAGNSGSLPLKTDSFQRWAMLQNNYAKSQKIQKEKPYWEEVNGQMIPLLPTDYQQERKGLKVDQTCHFVLDSSLTQKMQTQVHHVYNTGINDILLTALGLAIRDSFGTEKSVVRMEGHGREEIIEGADIGRTVGWFTSFYPFILDISAAEGKELIKVKESLRRIPNKGVGYGILNYLDTPFSNELIPSIQFNYLGDFGNGVSGSNDSFLFDFSSENIGASVAEINNQNEALLDVLGIIVAGELNISIQYSSYLFKKETVENLTRLYKKYLCDVIEELSKIKRNDLDGEESVDQNNLNNLTLKKQLDFALFFNYSFSNAIKSNLIVIHEGSGEILGYRNLFENVKKSFNIWCFTLNKENLSPTDVTPEQIAVIYAKEIIKQFRHSENVYLLGWSYGGYISYLIANYIEAHEIDIDLKKVIMIDTSSYINPKYDGNYRKEFFTEDYKLSIENEKLLVKTICPQMNIDDLSQIQDLDVFWRQVQEKITETNYDFSIPAFWANYFNKYYKGLDLSADLSWCLEKINRLRTIGLHIPKPHQVPVKKTDVIYFNAKNSEIADVDYWETLTESEFIAKEIEGNHGSIMNTPNIQELALFILASMEKPQNKGVNVNTKYEI
ncbi:non-ribosomal peptide synthetase [Chryseobacterium bernardetii]|uniref:non-ribosomal peptide synthetase n=1 Tax=Chryseobacterium bernardetii TaxID=1241978 RepID=UPI00162732C2|nr:non-ribosomal peptide synthetase [Chryseobacterium bernardetii]